MFKSGDVFQNNDNRFKTNYKYQIDEYIDRGAFGRVYKVSRVYETHTYLDVEVNLNK